MLVVDVEVWLVVPEAYDLVNLLNGPPCTLRVEDLRLPVLGIRRFCLSFKCGNKTRTLDLSNLK